MSKAAILALVFLGFPWTACAEPGAARMGGTGSATALLKQVATEFNKQHGGAEVVGSLGSTGAIRALADGVIDIAVSGRPLTAEEETRGLKVALTMQTPFIFATSQKNPRGLSAAEIVQAFLSSDLTWSDGTPIRVILRPRSESDVILMSALFAGLGAAMETARKRPGLPVAATDQDNAELAEQIPGSLVGLSLTQLVLEKRNLRVVPIDGLAPIGEGAKAGTYPYAKTLYFLTREQPSGSASAFISFISSDSGQAILREARVSPVRAR